ncbi:endoribonuclease l-PSP domain-containing protein [Sarocladium implicatum]|nr:endoribonuclease l-PSP domain-containing protein [Sarocladium implicatum]
MASLNQIINPTHLAPAGPFSHSLIIPAGHNIIFTAGQIGTIDRDGTIPDSYEEQVEAAISNLRDVLAASGARPSDIVKLTYFIADYDVNRRLVHINALQKLLAGHKPATSLVGVPRLANPKIKFEIEAVAAVKPEAPSALKISSKLA